MEFTIEELENEIWKDIVGYEGLYQVSNIGRIARNGFSYCSPYSGYITENRRFIIGANKDGYRQVKLYKNGEGKFFMIHRLEMIAFVPNLENKPYVNHKNSIRCDNRKDNLEWSTEKENSGHAHTTNKSKRRFLMPNGEDSKASKLTQIEVDFIKSNKGILSQNRMAKKFNVSQSAISKILSKKTWNIT